MSFVSLHSMTSTCKKYTVSWITHWRWIPGVRDMKLIEIHYTYSEFKWQFSRGLQNCSCDVRAVSHGRQHMRSCARIFAFTSGCRSWLKNVRCLSSLVSRHRHPPCRFWEFRTLPLDILCLQHSVCFMNMLPENLFFMILYNSYFTNQICASSMDIFQTGRVQVAGPPWSTIGVLVQTQ